MSVTKHEQQMKENNRNKKNGRAAYFNYCLKHIILPAHISETVVTIVSYLVIPVIFLLDVITEPVISFHILYLFPLTFIALHSARDSYVIAGLALAIALQYASSYLIPNRPLEFPVWFFLLISLSNILYVLVARYTRTHTLEANRLSTIDPLTSLCNRRGFDKAIEKQVGRGRRYGERSGHLSLAVLDLDGFKGLNDTLGHKAGDQALMLLADILRNHMRHTDTIARLGGDEFVVFMPNTKASDCDALCHLLCHSIQMKLTKTLSYPISASIGFTTIEKPTEASVEMLSIADKALYRAKNLGKGCVVRGYVD